MQFSTGTAAGKVTSVNGLKFTVYFECDKTEFEIHPGRRPVPHPSWQQPSNFGGRAG